MKKLFSAFVLVMFFAALISNKTYAADERVARFNSNAFVSTSGVVTIVEEISYDFGTNNRHGIYRNIKIRFENDEGKKYETPLKVIDIRDEKNETVEYTETKEGDELALKIGDPDKKITGIHTYIITYEVEGAIEEFSDHDEIFWNVTGTEWEVPIDETIVTVHMPDEALPSLKAICYTGKKGSTDSNCLISQQEEYAEVHFKPTQALNPGEGLTIGISFDKGIVTPTPKIEIDETLSDLKALLLTIVGLIWYVGLPLGAIVYYFKNGRDPKPTLNTIPVLFEPPSINGKRLSPVKTGTIIDETVNAHDITAIIVDLAIRGHIKITEEQKEGIGGFISKTLKKKNYILTKTNNATKDKFELTKIDKFVLDKVFEYKDVVTTDSLAKGFQEDAKNLKKMIYEDLVTEGFFPSNPEKIRNVWYGIGLASLFTVNAIFGVVALVLAKAMPRRTKEGTRVKIEALGLKKFLTSQEKQLEFQEENWYLFEKLLPYAVAFGVTKTWAKRFEHLQIENPSWYEGSGTLNTVAFASSLDNLGTSIANAATPTSSSSGFSSGFSGGGFSGGGFSGGGGGGSW